MTAINFLKIFVCVLYLISAYPSNGQCSKPTKTIYGKVIETDTISKSDFSFAIKDHGNNYNYGIYHIKVQSYRNDTLLLGIVYLLKDDKAKFLNGFSLSKDSAYMFLVTEFTPCNSDFPHIRGCEFLNQGCYFLPQKGQIVSKPYQQIFRIIESSTLYKETWEDLKKRYN